MAQNNTENTNTTPENTTTENSEVEVENQERKKTLYEMLMEIIKALRHRPCYEALERIAKSLDDVENNSETTAVILENLIHTTSELASKIGSISIEDAEKEIGKIEKELNDLSQSQAKGEGEKVFSSYDRAIKSYGIDTDSATLYKSDADGELYIKSGDNYYMVKSQSAGGFVQFGFVPVEEDVSISRLKLNEVNLDESYSVADAIRLEILREHFPDLENFGKYDKETQDKIQNLMEAKKQKEELIGKVNDLYNITTDANGISGVLRDDKTYCVIHERQKSMIEFKMSNNKIVASLYSGYDNSDPKNPKGTGAKKTVGIWTNSKDGKIHSELDFDRQYIVRDIIKSDITNRYLSVCGLTNDDIKTMLKEQGVSGFKKANDEHIKRIDAIMRVMDSNAPSGWDIKLIHDDSTYICAVSPDGNKTYFNFDEKGGISQYAYKYDNEKDVSLVADKGKIIVRNNRADQADYKISVKLFEESVDLVDKAINERNNKKEDKTTEKSKKEKENHGRD